MSIESIIKEQINELTEYDINHINKDTKIEDIGLASLDFISIQVKLKRELGIIIDANRLAEANIITFDDLINFIKNV